MKGIATQMFAKYIIGLDLGQQKDYSVLTVTLPVFGADGNLTIELPYMYRYPLRMSYVHVVEYLEKFLDNKELENYTLVVDHTGVGRPVVDLLSDYGINSVGITITGGHKSRWITGRSATVPKFELISRLQVAIQCGKLKIAKGMACLDVLIKELINFKASPGKGSRLEGARGVHDDTVLSLAMAVWYIEDKLNRGKKTRVIGS